MRQLRRAMGLLSAQAQAKMLLIDLFVAFSGALALWFLAAAAAIIGGAS